MIRLYGKNCINEAIRAKAPLLKIYTTKENEKKDKDFSDKIRNLHIEHEVISKAEMDKLFGSMHQGYGAIREDYKLYSEDDLQQIGYESTRILILDGIMDPHNLGAIIRSVDAFGFDCILLPKNRSCGITETVVRVSTGAIEYVKIMVVNSLLTCIKELKNAGFWICGTDASATLEANAVDKSLNLAVIIGSEGFGMSRTLVKESDYLIRIPMVGHVNSLNASVSCGIVLKEFMKKGE